MQDFFNAAENGDLEKVKIFLEKSISVNTTNDYNETVLIISVMKKQSVLTNYLLTRNDIDLHIQGFLTGTALTFAIFKDQMEIAKALLEKEKYFSNKDHPGAINWAILKGNKEILKLLLDKGADFNEAGLIPLKDKKGISSEWVWKPEPNSQNTPFHRTHLSNLKYTPLCLAITLKNYEMMDFLLGTCQVNPNKFNESNLFPLNLAIELNDEKAVEILLKYNVNIELTKETPDYDENLPSFLRAPKIEPNEAIKKMIAESTKDEKKSDCSQEIPEHLSLWGKSPPILPVSQKLEIEKKIIDYLKSNVEIWNLVTLDVWEKVNEGIKKEINITSHQANVH